MPPRRASSRTKADATDEAAAPAAKRARSTARKSSSASATKSRAKSPARSRRAVDPAYRPTLDIVHDEELATPRAGQGNNHPGLAHAGSERVERVQTRSATAAHRERSGPSSSGSAASVSVQAWAAVILACLAGAFVLDLLSPAILRSSLFKSFAGDVGSTRLPSGTELDTGFGAWSDAKLNALQEQIFDLESKLTPRVNTLDASASAAATGSKQSAEAVDRLNARLDELVAQLAGATKASAAQAKSIESQVESQGGELQKLASAASAAAASQTAFSERLASLEQSGSAGMDALKAQLAALQARLDQLSQAQQQASSASGRPAAAAAGSVEAAVRSEVQFMVFGDGTGQIDYMSRVLDGSPTFEASAGASGPQPSLMSSMVRHIMPGCDRQRVGEKGHPIPELFNDPVIRTGRCWPMHGTQGFLTVQMATPIIPTAVSYQHASRRVSHSFSSAPRVVDIVGLAHEGTHNARIPLGTMNYTMPPEDQLDTIQVMQIPKGKRAVSAVMFEFRENHGNELFTCVYRFRVHGEPGSEAPIDESEEEQANVAEDGVGA